MQKIQGSQFIGAWSASKHIRRPFEHVRRDDYLHLFNREKMNWYLAEYSSMSRKFFGYFENPKDTITSWFYTLDIILSYGKNGDDWEPMVDEDWKPILAKDIQPLKGYIEFIRNGTNDFT